LTEVIWNSLHGVKDIGVHEDQHPLERKFIESIDIKGLTCLDIGFNYGWWSWLFLKNIGRDGKVFAWEPNRFLYKNYLAKWPFKNLTGYNYALSDKSGQQDFHIYSDKEHKSGINSLEKIGDRQVKEVIKVDTKTLDDWWSENGGPNIDFIKIDAEWHDFKILQGGQHLIEVTQPSYIVVEQNDADVKRLLESLDYTDDNPHKELGLADTVWTRIQSTKEDIE
jgi:FkbM family methyltransferase